MVDAPGEDEPIDRAPRADGITKWVRAGSASRHNESISQLVFDAWFSNRKKAQRNAAQSDVSWCYTMS